MKNLNLSLWLKMADDMAVLCCTDASHDKKTVMRRVEDEGLSFLTITLPDYGKAIRKWLDQEQVALDPTIPFRKGRGGLPLFLGGYLGHVFDRSSGALLNDPSIDAIFALNQLTLAFSKISLPCSDTRVRKAIDDYVKCEHDVRQFDRLILEDKISLKEFSRISNLLFEGVFTQMDRDVHYGTLLPKHGPGAVADKLTSNGKYYQRSWTRRLEEAGFYLDEYLLPNHHFLEDLKEVNVVEPGSEMPVTVITVPKTLKTPRIIAVEPACMQYTQQALLRSFLDAHSRDELLSVFLGFDDQVPNQELARRGSAEGHIATLDLSEASDRVSNQLVRAMLSRWPYLQRAIDATRSRRAAVPGHGVIRLAKYASMGSALCFPMEACVFLTLIFLGIQEALNAPLTKKDITSYLGSVRVYGDDLIVPADQVHTIVQTLEHFGAQVGLHKSFWTGKFRESCGKEYFNGFDVGIVKVRQALPSTIADATGVISTVALRNLLYEKGTFPQTIEYLDSIISGLLKHYPVVGPDSPVLGRVSNELRIDAQRYHPSLHIPLVRGYVVKAKAPSDPLRDTGALLKCLLKLEYRATLRGKVPWHDSGATREAGVPPPVPPVNGSSLWPPAMGQDKKHLERSGRPKRVSIKLGWWPAG